MKKIFYGLIGLLVVGLLVLFFVMSNSSSKGLIVTQQNPNSVATSNSNSQVASNTADNSQPVREIKISASRFQYSPGTITVKQGEHVKITIDNTDTTHGMVIPELGVSGIGSVEFTADKAGNYEFHCPTMCGSGHKSMKGMLIVE